jgi:hypothetical protein
VFWDAALTIPAGQPIRTVGGYPSRAGTPSRMYVATDTYSITVRNKNRALVFSAFDQSDAPTSVFDISTQLITATAQQDTFTLTTFTYLPGTETPEVYRNGLRLNLGLDYLETNSVTITLTAPAALGDQFLFQGGAVITGDQVPGSDVSFIQAGTGAVTRNMQDKVRESVSVKDFGAIGNGIADDTAAIQATLNAAGAAGGLEVYLPPTGFAYKITDTLILPNGVCLRGVAGKNFAGATATNAEWAARGSWLNPTHPSNPAVRLQGHGSAIIGVNFIHNQPVPSGGSWTPNTYGYCIEQIISHSKIEDVMIVNASHGIHMNYTTGSGGGTNVFWKDIIVSAFVTRLKTTNANDTVHWSDIHCRNLWYSSNALVVSYIRANTKGWHCQYTDNIMVDGLEFFEDAVALYLEDGTCLGNTHSLYNGTLTNVQFNLPQVCIKVASATTTVVANFANCISQTGNAFGYTYADTAFQLATQNAFIKFTGLTVIDAGGQVFDLGTASGGKFIFDNLDVNQYSTSAVGQVCFGLAAGARLRLSGYKIVRANAAHGAKFAGAGVDYIATDSAGTLLFFGRFTEQNIVTTTSYQEFSTNSFFRPGQSNVHQVRLEGELLVNTAQAGSTMSIRLGGGISGVEKTGISSDTTGWKTFDTGWVDVTQSDIDTIVTIGQLQIKSTVGGVNVSSGSIQVNYR